MGNHRDVVGMLLGIFQWYFYGIEHDITIINLLYDMCWPFFLHVFVHRKHEGLFFLGLMAIKCVSATFNNHLYGMIMDQAPKVWISWDLVKTMGWSYEIGNVSYEFSLDSHDFDQGGGLLSLLRQNWSVYLVGGWAQPLWKIWVRQMGVGNSQYDRKVIKFMFQSPPTSNMAIKHARLSQGQSGEIHWPMA